MTDSDSSLLIEHARFGECEELEKLKQKFDLKNHLFFQDTNGNTAFHMAAANGHVDVLKFLCQQFQDELEKKNLINILNHSGNTALHWAAMNGHYNAAILLLDNGADSKLHNNFNRTAIGEANIQNQADFCNSLIEKYIQDQTKD